MTSQNRRQHVRKAVQLNVIVHVGSGGWSVKGKSTDLSRGGAFIRLREPLAVGQRVDVFIEPQESVSGPIMVSGAVVHALGSGVGIAFSHASELVLRRIENVVANAR